MAALTRDAFVTELQSRGWSRFTAAELQQYLDWGLRDIVRMANWTASRKTVAIADVATPTVAFSAIDAGGVKQIDNVYITDDYKEDRLNVYGDEAFEEWLAQDPALPSNKGQPTHYYAYQDKLYLILAPDAPYDLSVWYVEDISGFGGNNVSGLPERLDEAILPAAEMYCFRRAREWEAMGVAFSEVNRIVTWELARQGSVMADRERRVAPYR